MKIKKKRKKVRKLKGEKKSIVGCTMNINNKYVDLDKKDMRYIYVKIKQKHQPSPPQEKNPQTRRPKTTWKNVF